MVLLLFIFEQFLSAAQSRVLTSYRSYLSHHWDKKKPGLDNQERRDLMKVTVLEMAVHPGGEGRQNTSYYIARRK